MLRFLADAEELGGDEPFTPEVLRELAKLVGADHATYCELDRVRKRQRLGLFWPDLDWTAYDVVDYWEIAQEHPVCSRHNSGVFRALKLSDFVSLNQLRNSRVFALWFGPYGVDRELNVAIPSPPWHTKTFLFDRQIGRRDFTERDRLVLDVLQPHLGRLWRAARVRRQLRAALESVESGSEEDTRAVVLLASGGVIEFASPAAWRLLRDYFGPHASTEAPTALADWFESPSPTLVCRREGNRLTISRSGTTLLLEESRDEPCLTAREQQVLAWVARGKTNAEVAEILWVTPATVRKHLENVYAKLGVRTRTAAVARFLGVIAD